MRWLGFIFRLVVVVILALWLVGQPGTANIVWHGYVIQTSAAFLGAVVLGLTLILFQIFKLWRWVLSGPRFWRLQNKLHKLQKGQQQIALGLVAIASGDAAEAGRLAVSARKLLGATTTTRLLQAQAAQLAGDHRAAKEIYRALAAEPESTVLGYRGQIMAALREGNWDEAEALVDRLRRLKPHTPWLSLIRFELATHRQRWDEASEALSQAAASRLLETPRAKRHQAALMVAASDVETHKGNASQALQAAEKAVRQAPDWLPAVLTLARKQLLAHHLRTATRTIERAWGRMPHPHLTSLYQMAGKAENPLDVHKQMERLVRSNPNDPCSHIALAETALTADLWGEARRHLMALVESSKATQGVYRILTRLERRESGNEQAAAHWLMKAAEALPDPRWLCSKCGGGHDEWRVICAHCGAFNSLEWQTPGVARAEDKRQTLITHGTLGSGM